jgi:uncharacterized membrane protein YfcA
MPHDYIILCLVAALAGAINAIAGGATLLTFPVLFASLGSTATAAVVANGTNTVALVPAALAALTAYRREIALERYRATVLLAPSLVGGALGSLLVVLLPAESFKIAVPWLILGAASIFALQPRISRYFGGARPTHGQASTRVLAGVVAFQFFVGVYGGYFGAGIGILMLAALAVMGMDDIHRMNAVKSLLGAVINGTSIVVFAASGNVNWPYASAMAVAAAAGGYLGAHTARRVNRALVRGVVVAIGFGLAAYYFYREFAA